MPELMANYTVGSMSARLEDLRGKLEMAVQATTIVRDAIASRSVEVSRVRLKLPRHEATSRIAQRSEGFIPSLLDQRAEGFWRHVRTRTAGTSGSGRA